MQEFIVSTLEDENDGNHDAGNLSLREAIALANEQEGADTITFDSNLSGGTIILNSGELLIDKSLNIEGLGADNLTIDAERRSRVFNIDDGNTETQSNVSIKGLTITGGRPPDTDGGGNANRENLTLSDSNVTENGGNGIVNLNASITINNSHLNNNGQAGLRSENSEITINNSFVDNNLDYGGIFSYDSELNIFNSSVSNNKGYSNGGITNIDTFREGSSITNIENSVISNSFSGPNSSAGAIDASTVNIKNSTVTYGSLIFRVGHQIVAQGEYKSRLGSSLTSKSFAVRD
jgi:CSLREA domain-containing protein